MFPTHLEADGVWLRPIAHADGPALLQYLFRPEVWGATSADPWTPRAVGDFIEINVAGMERGVWCRYVVCLEPGGPAIGDVGFGHVEHKDRRAEIGYHLAPEYWGQGVMRRAAGALIDWAFANQFHRIEATVMAGNGRSERVLQRLGFEREATLRDYKLVRGEFQDFSLWARIAPG